MLPWLEFAVMSMDKGTPLDPLNWRLSRRHTKYMISAAEWKAGTIRFGKSLEVAKLSRNAEKEKADLSFARVSMMHIPDAWNML